MGSVAKSFEECRSLEAVSIELGNLIPSHTEALGHESSAWGQRCIENCSYSTHPKLLVPPFGMLAVSPRRKKSQVLMSRADSLT